MPHIFEVEELTRAVGDVLESQFPFVWVRGQVGNVTRPPSGHVYFTLRDEKAQLSVVWFKSARRSVARGGVNPATGELMEQGYTPDVEEGTSILVAGRLNVYAPRGQYQLIAEMVQEEGLGELALRFEAMKARLAQKGYFDEDRKMRLPASPRRVALVTSPSGAAVRDFLRIAGERGAGCEIRIHPVLVQGDAAPAQIAQALDDICEDGWADVAVVVRGGGSLEDLWAFNTEPVAEAIHRAILPVLSGVGHEVDTTIADYVADARAATPSHAAQMLWPARSDLMQGVDALEASLMRAGARMLADAEGQLRAEERALAWLSPAKRVAQWGERFDTATRDLMRAWDLFAGRKERDYENGLYALGAAYGPPAMDERARTLESLVRRMAAAAGEQVRRPQAVLDMAEAQLSRQDPVAATERALELAETRLHGLNPLRPLERGYGLVQSVRTGKFLRSVDDAAPGDELDIRVHDGRVAARVTGTRKGGE